MNASPCNSCAAIIMAGGSSKRMGKDKRFLKIGNDKLIEKQVRFLKGYFDEVIVSANDPEQLDYLQVPIIPDAHSGRGPLEGLTTALSASHAEYSFVVAVDIPEIDMEMVEKMRAKLDHVSAVIPVNIEGEEEPLFAFYSKNCIPIFKSALARGERAIHRALQQCPVYHFPLGKLESLRNLNSESDYRDYLRSLE
jgi:molybdopterin-guanine dinucleotide biosynthesis protein A